MTKLEELIKVSKEIKKLQGLEKSMKEEILEDTSFDAEVVEGYKVSKIIKRLVKLKDDVDVEALYEKFPEVKKVVVSTDMKVLEKLPDAHDMLEIKKSEYIMIKEQKVKDTDF